LRVVAVAEGFFDVLAGPIAGDDQALDVFGRQAKGLLTQDVLARLHRADAPFQVQIVRQRDVDRVDLRIGEQRLIACMGPAPGKLAIASSARARSREAMAPSVALVVSVMAGRVRCKAIAAVPSTPHRIGFMDGLQG
jgi:hypothetical protein